jgi:regulator of replication initiation timing
MKNEKKVEVLKKAADQKRQDALERTTRAINNLVDKSQPVTFSAVAQEAGVSIAYLYKYSDIKDKINHLKILQKANIKSSRPQPASDKSRLVIINNLRERIKKLEEQNTKLNEQNRAIYGRICQLQDIQQKLEALKTQNASLKAENEWLKQQLEQSVLANQSVILPTSNSKGLPSEITDQIQEALADIELKINSTLAKTIRSTPEATVLVAIDALKEAMMAGTIERPGGWLKRAIEECWNPNATLHQQTEPNPTSIFKQWFDLARAKGLVVASMKGEDEQIYVFDQEGIRYPFVQMLGRYPIELLKN